MRSPRSVTILCSLTLLPLVTGCPSKESLGMTAMSVLGPGVINDPKNKSLRFDILKFGLASFCTEMQSRGAPLKMRDEDPVLGRFFAEGCNTQIIDEDERKSLVVQYTGRGYGWTNLTGRLGFTSSGLVEYEPDFQLQNGAMYVYFRPKNVASASFQTLLVESAVARAGIAVTGVNPDQLGHDIVDGQLKRGFTVIRKNSNGETVFGMGVVPLGELPFRPFYVESEDKVTLDDDRTEVHSNQQDLIGGFAAPDDGKALTLTMKLDGAAAVDVFVLGKSGGDQLLDRYVRTAGPAQLFDAPLFSDTLVASTPFTRQIPVPKGAYYLFIDNSSALGRASPPVVTGDDRAARVDYVVQLGDRP